MDVLVQSVHTWWTTASRGSPASARRNATPVGFVLPTDRAPQTHTVVLREADGFAPVSTWRPALPDRARDLVRLRQSGDRVGVMLLTHTLYGAPRRSRRPPAVTVAPGEWVRWQINYRITSALGLGEWRYELRTLNVGVAPLAVDAFLGEPTWSVDERALLR